MGDAGKVVGRAVKAAAFPGRALVAEANPGLAEQKRC
jgi:hypothetical protein